MAMVSIFISKFQLCSCVLIAGASVSIFAFSQALAVSVLRVRGLLGELLILSPNICGLWIARCYRDFYALGPKLIASPTELGSSSHFLPHSSVHRLFIWQTTIKHIEDRPILGHGFDTARSFDKKILR